MITDYTSGFQGLNLRPKTNVSNRSVAMVIADIFPQFNRPSFVQTVKEGDVLISKRGIGGLVGHAAIMMTDYYVLEMPGGEGWATGIEDNNRRINKYDWFDIHKSGWITVYRNEQCYVARAAAKWAGYEYYNSVGGTEKTKHITYRLTNDVWSTNPSYCSKLVMQAFRFGNENRRVVRDFTLTDQFIVPSKIPSYFLSPYTLQHVGTF